MKRIPEPDLMNDSNQVQAYANADFNEPNTLFIELFKQIFSYTTIQGYVLDLGCGPADIAIRFANTYPRSQIEGVDGAKNMLKLGREAVRNQNLDFQIDLICGYLPKAKLPRAHYNVIISNSLLHHLTDSTILWEMIKKYSTANTSIFIMDLIRPDSVTAAKQLVEDYAAAEPAILQEDFFNSLCASYRLDEISEQLQNAGLDTLKIKSVSDRHFIVYGRPG